ncbi:hypothetical protein [Streptomyces orinoci]|uniref:Secreted protein n=1 Tax=Streptomyces orinoci TaxID=67339 RepID=A0ABV3K1P3_STRON|nr:hypothetical protein [Streptomyces orinoci]
MNRILTAGALALLTACFTAVAAVPAQATSVIGFGNDVIDNFCGNHSSHPHARAASARSAGGLNGDVVTLGGSSPVNQCADLGVPLMEMLRNDQAPLTLALPEGSSLASLLQGAS